MNKESITERREGSRRRVNLGVCVTTEGKDKQNIESSIINMSLLGCAIEPRNHTFKEQEKISICFVKAKENCSKTTRICAKVCHVCDEYIGLCFEKLGDDVIELLRELLKEEKYF